MKNSAHQEAAVVEIEMKILCKVIPIVNGDRNEHRLPADELSKNFLYKLIESNVVNAGNSRE